MKRLRRALLFAAFSSAALPALAHHALEFIETESYSTMRAGQFLFHLHYDRFSEDKNDPSQDHWEITPGLSYGITDRLMFDAHVHYAGFENGLLAEDRQPEYEPDGPSPFLEAAAFSLQYRLTEGLPVNVAVVGTYEAPFDRARELLDSRSVYEGTLILVHDFGTHGNVTLNLTYGIEGSEDIKEYALAVKNALTQNAHGVAAGLELLGDMNDIEHSWSVLPGIYIPFNEQTLLKTGLEISNGQDYTRFNVTLMHMF